MHRPLGIEGGGLSRDGQARFSGRLSTTQRDAEYSRTAPAFSRTRPTHPENSAGCYGDLPWPESAGSRRRSQSGVCTQRNQFRRDRASTTRLAKPHAVGKVNVPFFLPSKTTRVVPFGAMYQTFREFESVKYTTPWLC